MTVKNTRHVRGFSIIETMVAISVLLVAVVGPISIIGNAVGQIYFVRDQVTAINLAQEGIEVVRQRRDTNFLNDDSWDEDFGNGDCTGGLTCLIDTNPTLEIIKCTGGCPASKKLVYKGADGFYHQSPTGVPAGGIPTLFSRELRTIRINNNEYNVTVTVTWNTGGTKGSIVVSESIFRWAKA